MKVPLNVFVEMDTRNWFETVAATLSRQREKEVTLAEAIDYVSKSHWSKTMKRAMDQRHVERYGPALKGTKLIRGKGLVKS